MFTFMLVYATLIERRFTEDGQDVETACGRIYCAGQLLGRRLLQAAIAARCRFTS